MAEFDLRRLDLNLVVVLHALLEERNVSAAARRLGVTQSAASQSLAKLRKHFDDDLLQWAGRRHDLTPLGASLAGPVDDVVERLGALWSPTTSFDPALVERDFVLLGSDYAAAMVGGPLVRRLAAAAPAARLRLEGLPPAGPGDLKEVLSRVDGLVTPRGMDPPGDALPLFEDQWCCVVDAGLGREAAGWRADDLRSRGWVATDVRGTVPARDYLRHAGIEVDVVVRAPTFSAVPYLVAGTPHVGVMHRRLAERLATASGTTVVDVPWDQPTVSMVVFFDRLRAQDPAVRWFLDELVAAAHQDLGEP